MPTGIKGSRLPLIERRRRKAISNRAWYQNNTERIKKRVARYGFADRRSTKITVLTHYGKEGMLQCCWEDCRETDVDVLTIDHINNDGNHRKNGASSSGKDLHKRLIREGFPKGFQTLCANHQLKKELIRRRKESKWVKEN
jgi:hypothetical protein